MLAALPRRAASVQTMTDRRCKGLFRHGDAAGGHTREQQSLGREGGEDWEEG